MSFVDVKFEQFFDREAVIKRMDRKRRRVLARTGGFARGVVRRSMRPAGKSKKTQISRPGKPPRTHERLLKDRIFFGFDSTLDDGVVGPELLKVGRPGKGEQFSGARTVPELLEKGGVKTVRRKVRGKVKTVRQTYRPRPYISVATPKVSAKMADIMEQERL